MSNFAMGTAVKVKGIAMDLEGDCRNVINGKPTSAWEMVDKLRDYSLSLFEAAIELESLLIKELK